MDAVKGNRISYFDNLRFFLMVLVVVGHFIADAVYQSELLRGTYLWIYSFHMPLFFFLSGMFHKDRDILPKVMRLLMIGVVLKIAILLVSLFMYGKGSLSYYATGGIPWFMFVLAGYMALSYWLRRMDKGFILAFAVILGLFSGYDATVGDAFFASRFLVFYPFFVLGQMITPDAVRNIARKPWIRVPAVLILAAWAALCVFKLDDIYLLRPLFTGRNPFGGDFETWGFLYRGLCYLIATLMGFSVMCVIPQIKIPVITRFGSRTLQIYFWHAILVKVLENLEFAQRLAVSPMGKLAILLLAVALTFLLGLKVFGFPTAQIVKASRYKKEPANTQEGGG